MKVFWCKIALTVASHRGNVRSAADIIHCHGWQGQAKRRGNDCWNYIFISNHLLLHVLGRFLFLAIKRPLLAAVLAVSSASLFLAVYSQFIPKYDGPQQL